MAVSLKKIWNDYGVGAIVVLLLLTYGVSLLANNLYSKGRYGAEYMESNMNAAYKNNSNSGARNVNSPPSPSEPLGQNEVFSSANGIQTTNNGGSMSCSQNSIQNPSELLPKDTNTEWARLNPSGKGELSNVNLLKAGYHIGIDTIGQSLRNANLQIRSEPPNPQLNTGPWNQSTITPDFMRVPLEIGVGSQ
jgi:hypothetical protein